jgi:hypothetical protein
LIFLRKPGTFISDLEPTPRFRFLSRRTALRRGAALFIALVACGFLAQTALAAPPPELQTPPPGTASAEVGDIAGAANAGTASEDPTATATTGQSATPAVAPTPAATATPTPSPDSTAATDQDADSAATAAQQQPSNVVVIIRVNSPGNDGPITQNNVAAGTSNASNGASTTQDGAANAATTGQEAGSTATATQDDAGNVVITVRNGSPGKDGSVDQTNGAVSGSNATNTSNTDQQVAAPAPIVPPQTRGKGAAASPKQSHRRHPQSTAASSAPAVTFVEPTETPPERAPAHRHASVARHSVSHEHHASVLSSVRAGAGQLLSPLTADTSPAASATGPGSTSPAVLLTLLALITAAAATFVVRRRLPVRRAASSPRRRR